MKGKDLNLGTLLIVIGVSLRLYFYFSHPLNFDDLIQYDLLSGDSWHQVWHYLISYERQMPLNYLLYFPIVKVGGASSLLLRAPALVLSLLTLFVFFLILRRKESQSFSLLGAGLFSLMPLPLEHALSIRPYNLLLLTGLLTYYLYELIREKDLLTKEHFFFVLSFFALIASHPFGVIYGGIFALYLAATIWTEKKIFQNFPLLSLGIWGGGVTALILLISYLINNPLEAHPNHYFPSVIEVLGGVREIFGGLLSLIGFVFFFRKKTLIKNTWGLLFIGIVLGATLLLSLIYFPMYRYRYFILLAPVACVIFLSYLKEVRDRKVSFYFFTILLTSGLLYHSLVTRDLWSLNKSFNLKNIIQERPNLVHQDIISCGNCPSFYFSEGKLSCYTGWDLSQIKKTKAQVYLMFHANENFCRKHMPDTFIEYRYPGVSVFLAE